MQKETPLPVMTFLVWDGSELTLTHKTANGRRITNFWLHGTLISEAFIAVSFAGELFEDETIVAIKGLGAVLRRIHDRLVREGYIISGGKIYLTP